MEKLHRKICEGWWGRGVEVLLGGQYYHAPHVQVSIMEIPKFQFFHGWLPTYSCPALCSNTAQHPSFSSILVNPGCTKQYSLVGMMPTSWSDRQYNSERVYCSLVGVAACAENLTTVHTRDIIPAKLPVFAHPTFSFSDHGRFRGDIALLNLRRPIVPAATVLPLTNPRAHRELRLCRQCTVVGWGLHDGLLWI